MRIIVTNTLFAAASAALTMGAMLMSAPATAHAADVLTRHAAVHYGDLDLGKAAGQATLNHRIRAAASTVCAAVNDIAGRAASAACRKQAIAGATHQIDAVLAGNAAAQRIALR